MIEITHNIDIHHHGTPNKIRSLEPPIPNNIIIILLAIKSSFINWIKFFIMNSPPQINKIVFLSLL